MAFNLKRGTNLCHESQNSERKPQFYWLKGPENKYLGPPYLLKSEMGNPKRLKWRAMKQVCAGQTPSIPAKAKRIKLRF